MRRWAVGAAVWLGMIACAAGVAHGGKPASPPAEPSNPRAAKAQPAAPPPAAIYTVPLIVEGLKLSDFARMEPRAELKDKLLHISGFIQNSPHDGQPATEETEVWLGYTKSALYIVFICHDHHPEQIRGHLARRENILNDDNVSVLLDPFQDRRKGILFTVNPVGVQADAAWADNISTDYSYDQVWDSEGQVTDEGWMALMAIPFRSLRFRPNGADWGVVFGRNFPRNSETDNWPHIATNITGVLSQEATLHGIEGVTGSHNVQINPYVLGQNERTLETVDPLNPYFSSRHIEGTAGGEVKAILKDSIIFDATINPDFSDVESDQPQFTVNQRYPVYFPELRPFFLENANYFIHSDQPDLYAQHRASGVRRARDRQDTPHEPGVVCHRRPGARADGGARRSALQQARKGRSGAHLPGSGQRIGHWRNLYRRGVGAGMESHRGHRLHRADERQMDGDRTDGGKLDQRHGG